MKSWKLANFQCAEIKCRIKLINGKKKDIKMVKKETHTVLVFIPSMTQHDSNL